MVNATVEAIGSDFDGVYPPDSDGIHKRQAWNIVMKPWEGKWKPYFAEASLIFGSGKPGGRNEILAYMLEKLGVPAEDIPPLVIKLSKQFNDYVQAKILEDGLTPGSIEMLEGIKRIGIPIYLNSGTATPALVEAARGLNIDHYFRGILGSTREPIGGSKVENLIYIAEQTGADHRRMLVIGDGDSDVEAARAFGCRFVGIANPWNGWAESKPDFDFVTDLRDVLKYL